MTGPRRCVAVTASDTPCRAAPLHDADYCFWHDPASHDAAQAARRQGGLRRQREAVVTAAFDLDDLASLDAVDRLLAIAVTDSLQLANPRERVAALTKLIPHLARRHEERASERTADPRTKRLPSCSITRELDRQEPPASPR